MRSRREQGFVLIFCLVLMLLISAATVTVMLVTNTDTKTGGSDLQNMQAYYGAEAAMEKMMSDLNALFGKKVAPTVDDLAALEATPPVLPAPTSYSEYSVEAEQVGGTLSSKTRTISSGPNAGLVAFMVPLQMTATARGGALNEVRMRRQVEVVLIPVFQFGIFSDTDLSYYPGPGFDFAGRVHTNENLFLSTKSSLTFHNKITAGGEIIRAVMANGVSTSAERSGPIYVPTGPDGCDGSRPGCRDLEEAEGSRVGGPFSGENPKWVDISLTTYDGMILNKETGAKPLLLPFVSEGMRSVEIIRRPNAADTDQMTESRLYNQAQIRILLNDRPELLPGGAGVRLANEAPYMNGGSFGGTDTAFAEGKASGPDSDDDFVAPAGTPSGGRWPLIDGYLLVEVRTTAGYMDVTEEWLDLGIARENPNAILRFQSLKDGNNFDGAPDYSNTASNRRNPLRFLPINLYDAREGEARDVSQGNNNTWCALGGIFNVIELDVGNLKSWLGGGGVSADDAYILFFSDQRGSAIGTEGYGYEDVVNAGSADGTADGALGAGEDLNGDGILQKAGSAYLGDGFFADAQGGDTPLAKDDPRTRVEGETRGRKNRVTGPRHALKLVNGSLGNLPVGPGGKGGFTVASENPVYVMGDYNASGGFNDSNVPAAIIADSVTLLSRNWTDWGSFRDATYLGAGTERTAASSWYRFAVAAGKVGNYPLPGWAPNDEYGLDGGTHNFLRYLERWDGATLHYKGSLVSLFYSEYANGIYKCCNAVYRPPDRDYSFDTKFLKPANLPPGTPRFRDVVNRGYQQILLRTPDEL